MKQEDEEIDVSDIVASKKTQPFCPFLLSNFDLFASPSRSNFDSDSDSISKPPLLLRPSSLLSFRREDMSIGLLAKREARDKDKKKKVFFPQQKWCFQHINEKKKSKK